MLERSLENFSRRFPEAVFSVANKERKARTMVAVLRDFLDGAELKDLHLLDVGASAGVIAHHLSSYFGEVFGLDMDPTAIDFARRSFSRHNLHFIVGNAMDLPFPEDSFDVLICAHLYEHVTDANQLMLEVYRVLKPGGICYFAAGNRIALWEPHYALPLLSTLPRPLSHIYLRISGKGQYYFENLLTYPGLRRLVGRFSVIDYTRKIVEDPRAFFVEYMLRDGSWKAKFARVVLSHAYWLCPTYIWLLQKPRS